MLRNLHLIHLDAALLDATGMVDPGKMRSLDAMHLAAAALIAPELTALVTYDERMAEGAPIWISRSLLLPDTKRLGTTRPTR